MNSHMILNRFYQPLEILLNTHYDPNGTHKMGSWAAPTSIIFHVPSFLQLLGSQISAQFNQYASVVVDHNLETSKSYHFFSIERL